MNAPLDEEARLVGGSSLSGKFRTPDMLQIIGCFCLFVVQSALNMNALRGGMFRSRLAALSDNAVSSTATFGSSGDLVQRRVLPKECRRPVKI